MSLAEHIRLEAALADRPGQMARLEAIALEVEALERGECPCGKPLSHADDPDGACLVPLARLQESNPSRWGVDQ